MPTRSLSAAEQEGARVVRVTYPALGGLGGPRVGASVVRQLGMTGDPDVDNRIRSVAGEDVAALAELDPQALLAEQSFVFLKLVESKATEQPLVIVIDDTHRSTGRLLELVSTVSNRLRAAPVMVVMVGRNEGMWLNAFASPTVLRIDPLGRAASAELVRALAPALAEGDPDLIDTIVERASGNPLFLRELAGAADVGGTLPPTLQAILAARVDALAPPVKLALQHVAVFGGGVVPSQVAALGPESGGDPSRYVAAAWSASGRRVRPSLGRRLAPGRGGVRDAAPSRPGRASPRGGEDRHVIAGASPAPLQGGEARARRRAAWR